MKKEKNKVLTNKDIRNVPSEDVRIPLTDLPMFQKPEAPKPAIIGGKRIPKR